MARIENKPKLFLTQEEIETLRKARNIFIEIEGLDTDSGIFNMVDNYESEWWWLIEAIENTERIAEVE